MKVKKLRYLAIILWMFIVLGGLYIYFFERSLIQDQLAKSLSTSLILGYGVFLLLGSLRGFTLIPSTYLIIIGLLFFRPVPLFFLTLTGTMISSLSVYWFAESLHLHEYFERKHKKQVDKLTTILQKNELPIIIGWSFFPFTPTDLICYICGILEVNFKKFVLGIFIGEGICTAAYVFFGQYALRLFHLSF